MLVDVRSILELHAQTVARWHAEPLDNPYDGFAGLVCRQHQFNFLLWHEEDVARSPAVSDARIAQVKRAIDRYNQSRNDLIEKLDDEIAAELQRRGVTVHPHARLNTETAGSAIDRLSILSLRIYHLQEQLERPEATLAHLQSVAAKLQVCLAQRDDLSQALERLEHDLGTGQARHRIFRQLKMYNDPALNPYLNGQLPAAA